MTALLLRARNGLFVTAIGLMFLSLLAPAVTLADTSLTPGSAAVVAGTNGDGVTLRSDMGTNAPALQTVPEGTPLQILDGPLTAADGSVWYSVSVNGTTGYVAAEFVSGAGNTANAQSTDGTASSSTADGGAPTVAPTQAPQDAIAGPSAATVPWKPAVAYGVVNDNIGQGVPADGLFCRVDVSTGAAKITQVYVGDTVEITGDQIQNEGLSWFPVNCAGVGGFIDANWVQVTSSAQTSDATTPDQTAQTTTDQQTGQPADIATAVPTEAVTVAPTEAPAEVVATTAPADGQQTVQQPAQDQTAAQTQTDAPAAPETVVTEIATQAPAETTDVTVALPTDAPATDAPANKAPATEAPATVAPAESQPAADTAAATQAATVAATAPATTAPAETTAATQPAEAAATAAATEPAQETATATATQDAATPTEATVQTAEASTPTTANETATAVPTQTLTTESAANATPATLDLSQSIGTAEVKGTNGDGVRCRVSPADDAATITLLAEGTKVSVMGMPANGWLPVACGDQVGYANLEFMWQGGAVQGDFSSSDTGGTVKVQGTGNGLNCRTGAGTSYGVITVVFDGTSLEIRGVPRDNWLPVTCGGQAGYVYIDYVSAPQGGGSSGGTSTQTTTSSGTATVSGTGGDGLICRTGASTGSAVITVLGEGTKVATRGSASGGWIPVVCAGQDGYIYSSYATVSSGSPSGSTGSGNTSGGSGSSTTSGSVVVTGTGNGLNCRTGAGTSYGVITVVFDGTTLKTRGSASGGWLPVVCGGQNGYVSSEWVTSSGGSSGSTGDSGSGSSGSDSGTKVTGSATVTGTGGDGVRCRTGAGTSSSTITVVGEGQTVSLRGSASGGWQPVVCAGQDGYIYDQYLTTSAGSGSSGSSGSDSGSSGGSTSGLGSGAHAQVTDALNLRYEPNLGSGVATVAPAGTVVLITGGASNGYYAVDWDGLKGYMAGDYLTPTDAALSKRGGSANDGGSGTVSDGGAGSATGNSLVSYAMGYLGYPYVWATHGPASFDCSGFTYWVAKNVLGIDIGTGLWTQVAAGTPVSRSNLQPGDLVFFQNTYEAGLSHVGIYIGGGQFIHAENESTGVKISDLGSQYYSSRWYGAVRL